RYQYYSGYTF
nr:immunoglobulin light chain junction region [Macaca mulatta]